MATIIVFDTARCARPASPARSRGGAEIVIFPGIRYERTPDSDPEPSPAGEGRKRDRLSIPD
jgi:hypothetical protein